MPARETIAPDELRMYDSVVERHEGLPPDYGVAQHPIYGALLNAPPFAEMYNEVGRLWRTAAIRGSFPDDVRLWADIVVAHELHETRTPASILPAAVGLGVRAEAVKALYEGRDQDLTADERRIVDFNRQVVRGTVTDESWDRMAQRLGLRQTVEYALFATWLIMTFRLYHAFGAEAPTDDELMAIIDGLVAGTITEADPKTHIG